MPYLPYTTLNTLPQAQLIALTWPLALLVGPGLLATHVPLVWQADADMASLGKLIGHVHAGNPQAAQLQGAELLAVFSGTSAYQSPTDYALPNRLPTYNYVAAQVWGTAAVLPNDAQKLNALSMLASQMEPENSAYTFDRHAPAVLALLPGLVAFEIVVSHVETTLKASQEKPRPDRLAALQRLLSQA